MCQMCETLDSMIECLESLYSVEKMREVMVSLADTPEFAEKLRTISNEDVKTNIAIDLLIHWTDSMGAEPLKIISTLSRRWADRIEAHEEQEQS